MKDLIHMGELVLQRIFLSKGKSDAIHNIKNEYTTTTLQSIDDAKHAKQKMEDSVAYKIGVAAGGIRR